MQKIYSISALMLLLAIGLMPTLALAEAPNKQAQFAVSIPDIYYEHPVHLLHPYLDYWLMKGPLLEKVVKNADAKTASTQLSLCNAPQNAEAVLVLQPHLFYNPQSRVFYAEIVANAYTQLGDPLFTTKQEAQQIGDLAVTPDYYIQKAYTKALTKVMAAVNSDQNLTSNLSNHALANTEVICKSLSSMSGSKIYY